jgi:hypothetical protein
MNNMYYNPAQRQGCLTIVVQGLFGWCWQLLGRVVRGFWFWGAVLAAATVSLHVTRVGALSPIDQLLHGEGPSTWVARLVLWLTFWSALALMSRLVRAWGERELVAIVGAVLLRADVDLTQDLDTYVCSMLRDEATSLAFYRYSSLRQRLQLWRERRFDARRGARLEMLMAGRSGVEDAQAEAGYGPIRALIWALPGLGFMGTALEIAMAIGGMAGLAERSPEQLVGALTGQVIPSIGGAFQITLFALGASVVCYLSLAAVYRYEADTLCQGDELVLQLLARVADDSPALLLNDEASRNLASGLQSLRTILQAMSWELSRLADMAPEHNGRISDPSTLRAYQRGDR